MRLRLLCQLAVRSGTTNWSGLRPSAERWLCRQASTKRGREYSSSKLQAFADRSFCRAYAGRIMKSFTEDKFLVLDWRYSRLGLSYGPPVCVAWRAGSTIHMPQSKIFSSQGDWNLISGVFSTLHGSVIYRVLHFSSVNSASQLLESSAESILNKVRLCQN